MQRTKFDISKLNGRLGSIRDWMVKHHLPPRVLFISLGIVSTVWFLIRVIPKPTRAAYPCMTVAAPFMSGFIGYLIAVGGLVGLSRKLKGRINVRYAATLILMVGAFLVMAISPSDSKLAGLQADELKMGPDDGPNQPFGEAKGIFPGRVVWVWNPDATNEKFEHNDFETYDWYFSEHNNNPEVIGKMFRDGIIKLTGEKNAEKAWESVFHFFNVKSITRREITRRGKRFLLKSTRDNRDGCLTRRIRTMVFTFLKPLMKVRREEQIILYLLNKVLMLFLKFSGN